MHHQAPPAAGGRLRTAYLWVLFSLLLLGGITFTLGTFHKVFYTFGWDDDEGAVWWEAAHVTNLRELYHPLQQYPYFVVPYPPVFHAATWLAAKFTGDFLVAGRLICLLSALGISLIFGHLVFHCAPRKIPPHIRGSGAALAMLLCFRLDSLNQYIPEMGVDLLALFLTFLGVCLFILGQHKRMAAYGSFACFVLAVFTKQTMVAAPLACLVATALIDSRRALRYLLFCVGLGAGALGLLAWATGGEALRHMFIYNARQPFSLIHLMLGWQVNLMGMIPIAAVAALAVLPFVSQPSGRGDFIAWLRRGLHSSLYRRAVVVLGLQAAFALVTSVTYGKAGSGFHYFMEWNLTSCALAGLLFTRALYGWRKSVRYSAGGAAIFLLLLLAALTGFPDSLRRINQEFRITKGERHAQAARDSSAAAALKIVEQTPGPVLCENMVLVMKAHKEIPIEPGIECFLGKSGVWDQSGFVSMISSQKFGVIIMRTLSNGFWTDDIVNAIEKNYVASEEIGDAQLENCHYSVYRPRPIRNAP